MKVRLEDSNDPPRCYHNCEICVVRNGKGKRPEGYVEPPLSELAKLRREPEERSVLNEEERLSAALRPPSPAGRSPGRPRRGRRSSPAAAAARHRKPKGEGGAASRGQQAAPKVQAQPQAGEAEGESGSPPRRRRHRSKGSGGKAPEGKSE